MHGIVCRSPNAVIKMTDFGGQNVDDLIYPNQHLAGAFRWPVIHCVEAGLFVSPKASREQIKPNSQQLFTVLRRTGNNP